MTLSKAKAIKILSKYDNEYYTPATRQAHRMGAEALAKDAVEVVWCKDCKHCDTFFPRKLIGEEAHQVWFCKLYRKHRKPTDFCSRGERRTDDE